MNETEVAEILKMLRKWSYDGELAYINAITGEIAYTQSKVTHALDKAVNCVAKQIPFKPNVEGDGYDDEGNLIYDTWICPCCKTAYEIDYDDYSFCPNCGQKIDRREING